MKKTNTRTAITLATLIAAALTTPASLAQLNTYDQNFEDLDITSPSALGDDGWLVFASVFDATGTNFIYQYGAFPAPNGSGGFSNVADNQGGPDQGMQQLVTFSDYNNADHGAGRRIFTNVFQQRDITEGDTGETYTFSFDAKMGDLVSSSSARAFIRILDPNAGFSLSREVTIDTASLPVTWNRYELDVDVSADLVGQILQFGFETSASNFDASGVFYDNVRFSEFIIDDDGDGVDDGVDNCLLVPNPAQRDTDEDGFGNLCDADLNNDNTVNVVDLGIFRSVFFSSDPDADFNGDGTVNILDLGIMRAGFFAAPGPAAGSVVTLFDDFEDGDVSNWLFFGNNVDSGGGGEVRGDASTPEGNVYFHTGWGGAGTASGFYGVAVRNLDNNEQIEIPAANPHLNFWVRNLPLSIPMIDQYTLEITLREDVDGNGFTDGQEDSIFVAGVAFPQSSFGTEWTFVSIPLAQFTDAQTGGNGVFDGRLDELVLGIGMIQGAPGSAVEPEFDYIHFTAGAPIATTP